MVRPSGHCCDNLNVKKGVWTADEDAKVLAYVSKHGTGNWTSVPKKAVSSAGPKRCGKSCKLRYTNCLRPDLKHESFSPQEEELIVKLHATIGSRWPIIAQQLPGRTDNEVKNYWNTKLRKKLTEMGIDPVTHKPFSQILSDYGNIGYLPKGGSTPRIGSLNRDLKNAFISSISEEHNNHFSTTKSPKTENISQYMTFLNNNNNVQSSNHSSDLLAQLQSINLVTDHAANMKNVELGSSLLRLLPSSSSSSTTCSAKVMAAAQLGCSWQDFLLEDAFSSSPLALDDDSSQNVGINMPQQGNEFMSNVSGEINGYLSHSFEGSSSETSFVEAMLKREDEMMLLEFPTNLLEEPYYY